MQSKGKYVLLICLPLLLLGLAGMYCVFGLPSDAGSIREHADQPDQPALDAKRVNFHGHGFDVVKIDPKKQDLRLFWKDQHGRAYGTFETLRDSLAKTGKKLRFATNAGIFSEDGSPGGLHIENGKQLGALNLNDGAGNFHLKPNGVFMLGPDGASVMESQAFSRSKSNPQIATQSGPMLVMDGELHPAFREGSDNKHVRNGVGVDVDGKIWFALSRHRVNFFDFATLFRDELHCPDALYLDGSISGFYLPELSRSDFSPGFCGILAVVE